MAFVAASRVLESFTTTGTGTITLAGAVTGYRAFSAVMSNADTCFYFMEGGSDWEIGLGTYSAGTLARTSVLKSSNSNNAVNWAAGTKTVGIDALGPNDKTYAMRTQVFTGSGTYTPSPGMFACIIECLGGGGGGGGSDGTAGQYCAAGGGGAGGYSRKLATSADIGASKAVTIGAAGSAGASGNNAGGAGGDTSVGSLCIGKGGTGGGGAGGFSAGTGGAGGVAGTGDVTGVGQAGFTGPQGGVSGTVVSTGGAGGSSAFGTTGVPLGAASTAIAGAAATGYGAGGCGATSSNVATNAAGGAGSAGLVIITEFIG